VDCEIVVGGLAESLGEARLALACSGTVTLECAYFAVPTVVVYRSNWLTFQIGRRLVTVPFIAMPNLLAGEGVFPELVQDAATPEAIAAAGARFLDHPGLCAATVGKLHKLRESLGPGGASRRAAQAILDLLRTEDRQIAHSPRHSGIDR
jgi:lipid-A-disaccharide synthase